MKTQLLAAAVVLATSVQAFGQHCGCESSPVVSHSVASCGCGCDRGCTPCFNPVGDLIHGIGFTIKATACTVKNGVDRLFHPIAFHGCGCDTTPSCGCDTCGSNWESYEMSSPGVEYIEPSHPAVPSIPGPPMTPTHEPTTEPSQFQAPGKWQPVGTQAKRPSNKVTQYSKRVTPSSSTRAATYYAPTRAKK